MSSISQQIAVASVITFRREAEGYLAFAPSSQIYLFTTDQGHKLLTALQDHAQAEDPIGGVASVLGMERVEAARRIALALDHLSGHTQVGSEDIGIWPLSEYMDGMADRCETFGMPF